MFTLRRNLITVLQRGSRPEHGIAAVERACALLDHLVREHGEALAEDIIAVMLDTPGALFPRLEAQVDTLPEPVLAAINIALPVQNVSWREFSLRVAERYAALARNWQSAAKAAGLSSDQRNAMFNRAAAGFHTLGIRLSKLGRHEEALDAAKEAVDIRRALAKDRPDAFLPDLAGSLTNLGIRLSNLGRREEALDAAKEAVDITRALAKDRPDAFLPDLAGSLNNLGRYLSNLGRREEALDASKEDVDIFRALAKDRPDAFLPDLAMSIGVTSDVLAAMERHAAAAAAAQEALSVLAPFVEQYPENFGRLARTIGSDVLKYSKAAGIEPDGALLQRVAAALGAGQSDDGEDEASDPVVEALKARIGAIIEAAQSTGELDETALAELPQELAEQLRAAWAAQAEG